VTKPRASDSAVIMVTADLKREYTSHRSISYCIIVPLYLDYLVLLLVLAPVCTCNARRLESMRQNHDIEATTSYADRHG